MRHFLRLTRPDEFGLRRAWATWVTPLLVATMAFLAALSIAGWAGAEFLARQWEEDAASGLTVLVPAPTDPDASASGTRLAAVRDRLAATKGVGSVSSVGEEYLNTLLRPWFGADLDRLAVQMPAVVAVRLTGAVDLTALAAGLAERAPGTVVEDQEAWSDKLRAVGRTATRCAGLVLSIVGLTTAAAIAAAIRSGLSARRGTIAVASQLGATDGHIAMRFALRAARLASIGGAIGGLASLPVVCAVTALAAPFAGRSVLTPAEALTLLPLRFWLLPPILAVATGAVGFITAQITVRRWLRRMS